MFAVLLPEAALYYGMLMAKVAPDTAAIPFSVAMIWALVRLSESGDGRWWLAAGLFGGLALLSKFTVVMFLPGIAAFMLVPDWRRRWLFSIYPWAGALIALLVFAPVLIWNAQHDWDSFKFQLVRATTSRELSLRTLGDYLGLQFGQVGILVLPVTLSALLCTAWRGYRAREPVAILLATAVLVPAMYFLWKSLTLRVGDTWPMFMWPVGFAAVAINVVIVPRENWRSRTIRNSAAWLKTSIASGIAMVVLIFLYSVAAPWNLIGKADPIGGEAGFAPLAVRAEAQMQATGATWIATTDYRTYAMLRWFVKDRVPVIQINERARFQGFRDPDMSRIAGHTGLYVARGPDIANPIWAEVPATLTPVEQVSRTWRGTVMDTYTLETLTGWTPELSPPRDTPLFRWRLLAGAFENIARV